MSILNDEAIIDNILAMSNTDTLYVTISECHSRLFKASTDVDINCAFT